MANLITAQEVIELAFSENSNMREESIPKTTIGVAEIKYIRPAFGAMYALLADKYADFTNEYVKPALAYFVKCEMMSSIAIDMSNSGVAVSNPQYQNAASDKQRQRLYDSEMGKAKTLLDYALSYIAVHSEEFPDYSGSIGKKSYRVGGILLGNQRVATSIMGEAFKEEYERYLREMQEINEVVVDATEDVSKALIATNEAIANTEEAVEKANTATTNANTATEKAEEATQKAEETISNAEKATNRANTAAENAEKVGEDIQRVEKKADDNAKEIQNINENAVKPDDYYPKMSVGFADNLVGRGEATAEEFTYRASAGMGRSITDDTARVKKIKGNSVVWNQRCNHQLYSESQTKNGVTLTPNGDGSFSIETDANGATELTRFNVSSLEITGLSKHKILIVGAPIGSSRSTYYLIDNFTGNYCFDSVIFTKNSASGKGDCYIEVVRGCVITTPVIFRPQYIDLTKMFGDGNEPTTVEEFYALIPSGIDIFAYNKGEIISMNTEAIKTVGLNQWDEQWEVGLFDNETGDPKPDNSCIRSKNYIKVIPTQTYYHNIGSNVRVHLFDINKQYVGTEVWIKGQTHIIPNNVWFIKFRTVSEYGPTYNHDICINLSHTGTENGKYKPYTPFTRELPIIQKYFPNGMRSAGNAFDSIEWDSSKQKWVAVQRIGTRAYEVGDESNAEYTTDGVHTNYAIITPITTEIEEENINFDYYVEDFGTEEAIASVPSAPFRADVVYTFNAVDTIRNNYLAIEKMKKQMVQMQNAISAMQVAQVKVEE